MAASSLNAVRVRLYFDYPPPAVSDCRMCWVLVDLNKCRVVADLASVIREKFDFSRRTILNLFIEDCYLPPTESVYVVRDNDSIRVKVENQPPVNGIEANSKPEGLSQKANKRTREAEEENEGLRVKKKKKKAPTEGQEVDPQPVVVAAEEKKKKKKRKKLKEKNLPVKPAAAPAAPAKGTTPVRQPAVSKPAADKAAKKPATPAAAAAASRAAKPKAALAPSSSETSDSSKEEPPKKAVPVTAPGRPGGAVPGAAKAGVAASSSWEPSSDSSPGPKPAAKPVAKTTAPPTPALPAAPAVRAKPRSSSSSSGSDSDSTSRTRLANRRPGLGHQVPPLATGPGGGAVTGRGGANPRGAGRGSSPGAGRGVGRGDGRFPWRGGSPRGGQRGGHGRASRGAGNHVFYCYGDQNGPQQQPQRHADDTLTNKAVVLQNPPESAPQPRRDYGSMPLLAAPPRVGQKIAFKLLELTENYTPEVSDYKEGKIIGIDQGTNQIELELLSSAPGPAGPGKFDLVYQTADGSEIVEYAVSRTSQLTERWDSLLEPRLILENNV
ncbi:coilin [Anguilla anguilla]|uniref:coilin n=1 Tax=Anguilla anguilla TaxID=7936 RepID=UPI0015B06B18|nr:coilin [Anguilla anguilla]